MPLVRVSKALCAHAPAPHAAASLTLGSARQPAPILPLVLLVVQCDPVVVQVKVLLLLLPFTCRSLAQVLLAGPDSAIPAVLHKKENNVVAVE